MRPVSFSIIILLVISALSACPALAATIYVPADQLTIQAGIDAAVGGDLVLVAPGTYIENIDFIGKAITLRSESGAEVTVINGNQADSVVTFDSGETEEAVIDNFTIMNGNATYGGGIYCRDFSSPTITNCTIRENIALSRGGGIICFVFCEPTITNCTIIGNSAEQKGGGIHIEDSNPTITNCTISENISYWLGGGIFVSEYKPPDGSDPMITNCILWGNSPDQINIWSGTIQVTYSDVQGGWPEEGNIDADPLFVGEGDYHIAALSPCIDAGIDAGVYMDFDGEVRPQGCWVDIGVDENPECRDCDRDHYLDEECGGDDCDDSRLDVHPGAEEFCDEMDNNCDGVTDDRDADGDGYIDEACGGLDCDDLDPQISPEALEICDGLDNDCDGIVPADETDGDGDGWLFCEDCDDTDPMSSPDFVEGLAKGNCSDGADNDCDGFTDILDPICNPFLVPSVYPTIQEGINVAENGGLILVAKGTYSGGINFQGKAITLKSVHGPDVTTIEGGGSVVTFNAGETKDTVLDGFTITGGTGTFIDDWPPGTDFELVLGGGIYCTDVSPTIKNCIITDNHVVHWGYPLPFEYYSALGGGIYCMDASPAITNCIITENTSEGLFAFGGGIFCWGIGEPTITHCTLTENSATSLGVSIFCIASMKITNSILWDDTPILGYVKVINSDVKGGWPGLGNIDADPLFVDPENGDYHITSESPCIDAGRRVLVPKDIDGEWRQFFAGFDMGADEYWPGE